MFRWQQKALKLAGERSFLSTPLFSDEKRAAQKSGAISSKWQRRIKRGDKDFRPMLYLPHQLLSKVVWFLGVFHLLACYFRREVLKKTLY